MRKRNLGYQRLQLEDPLEETYPGFERCIEMVRSRDPLTFEDGFWWLVDRAPDHADELLALARAERDSFTKGKFLELLGATRDERAIPVLAGELGHEDRDVRMWAVLALEELGFPEARRLADAYKETHPGEF